MSRSEQGKYRIQAVTEMTGVASATLRAWERRYGIPAPPRSSSAYRLYGEEDIEAIRMLIALREDGMSASEAADVVRMRIAARTAKRARDEASSPNPFQDLRDELIASVSDYSYEALERSIGRVMFVGNVSTVYEEVLAPVMVAVGDLWHQGKISIGQEHMATQLLEGAARDMLRMLEVSEGARVVILACFASEEHSLPLYGVAYRMVRWGFRPVMLGARTPASAIASAVEGLNPALVGISMTIEHPWSEVRRQVADYKKACGSVPIVVGGSAASLVSDELRGLGVQVPERPDLNSFKELIEQMAPGRNKRKSQPPS